MSKQSTNLSMADCDIEMPPQAGVTVDPSLVCYLKDYYGSAIDSINEVEEEGVEYYFNATMFISTIVISCLLWTIFIISEVVQFTSRYRFCLRLLDIG